MPMTMFIIYVSNQEVSRNFYASLLGGGQVIREPEIMGWGDLVTYCLDPDGHVIALAAQGR